MIWLPSAFDWYIMNEGLLKCLTIFSLPSNSMRAMFGPGHSWWNFYAWLFDSETHACASRSCIPCSNFLPFWCSKPYNHRQSWTRITRHNPPLGAQGLRHPWVVERWRKSWQTGCDMYETHKDHINIKEEFLQVGFASRMFFFSLASLSGRCRFGIIFGLKPTFCHDRRMTLQ